MLNNGSFDGDYRGDIANGWKDNSGWADLKLKYDEETKTAHAGKAQRIDCLSFRFGAVQFVQPGVSVVKGRSYEIGIWMKGNIKSPVEIIVRKRGQPYSKYFYKEFNITTEWQKYSFVGISLADDSNAYFLIRFTSSGTLWIDDATLFDITNSVSTEPPKEGNLISNGSFEVGLDRWGVLIRETGGYENEMSVEYLKIKPSVKEGNAVNGKNFLNVVIPKHGRVVITSPYIRGNPGRKYSVSCWLASDEPRFVTIGLGTENFRDWKVLEKSVRVCKNWTRFEASTQLPPMNENACYFILQSSGEGAIRIDGVRVEEGNPSEYHPRSAVEVGFKRDVVPAVYRVDEDIHLAVLVSATDSMCAGELLITSYDYFGHSKLLQEKKLYFDHNNSHAFSCFHPNDQTGYFRIVAQIRAEGRVVDEAEMAIGVVPNLSHKQKLDSPFGNHARFNEEQLGLAKNLGATWLRMHPPDGTKWFVVEKNKGQFVFYDEPILLARSLGFHILGSLDTTPRWASSAPKNEVAQSFNGFRSYPPKNMRDWEQYVYRIVSHYKGIIDYWEVWNEPDAHFLNVGDSSAKTRKPEVYADLLRIAYQAAKKANPKAVIVGGCATRKPPSQWFKKIFRYGAYDFMDVLSFHFYSYGRPGDMLDVPTKVHVDELRTLMRKYGKGNEKPIWETESGILNPASGYTNILELSRDYTTPTNDGPSYVVRNYVYLLSIGVSKWFYYSMFFSNQIDNRKCRGFFEWDNSPRPLAVAYAVLASVLEDAKFKCELDIPKNFFGAKFSNEKREVSVVWLKKGEEVRELQMPVRNTKNLKAYNIMGNNINIRILSDFVSIPVGKDPIYIVESKSPEAPRCLKLVDGN